MKPVVVPTSDVNSEHGVLVAWFVDDGAKVEAGTPLAEIETSKAVLEVAAPEAGIVLHLADPLQEVPLSEPIAMLFETPADLAAYAREREARAAAAAETPPPVRASVKAVRRAQELGVDLAALRLDRLVTVKDVEEAAGHGVDEGALPAPLEAGPGVQRIVLIGGGLGATQVLDILSGSQTQRVVAVVDDDRQRWGAEVNGVPVVGGSDRLRSLFAEGAYDAAIVAISTSVEARRRFREACAEAGIPLANAVDPTAKIATDVVLGQGNVICAFSHLGTGVRMGDNNFLSAYNSFDHHSRIGSDNSTGPSCVSSGKVTVGDRVRLGTGIFIEPHVVLGDDVAVASGAVIVRSVPAGHAVKTKIVTTTVVPAQRSRR
ncbi:biotin/lipoyl-containing protein [Micromonospora globbae]|uniref:biotin/lipoyl-containing protein n=1 Tax=Micromonospora globbae TaxID=1894969 RepID=UPI00386A2649|nr:bifunctional N-acetylglucosamine-1-phosphate uridyltransferase/glucosamine-1-phosphate acetyltransferase [Micromonospora globbae]